MKINAIYIGNDKLAFVENRFNEGINLIYANDNNKGKTILLQSIGYALGNVPVFPSGFDYQNYFYILDFEYENKTYSMLRKGNQFLVKTVEGISSFNSQSEMKKWFDKNIFILPKIVKQERIIVADFELFLQSFFLGQDKRDTSNINSNYFKKEDFKSMIYYMCGCSNVEISEEYIELKEKIKSLEDEQKRLLKSTKMIKKAMKEINCVSSYSDKQEFIKNKELMDAINLEIASLDVQRNKIFNRISKNNAMIKEINSLNRNLDGGELICLDCNSKNISYVKNKEIKFNVSTSEMRSQILNNLDFQNEQYFEEITVIEKQLDDLKKNLGEIIKKPVMNTVNLILYKNDIIDDLQIDTLLNDNKEKLLNLKDKYVEYATKFNGNIEEQKNVEKEILKEMNVLYSYFESSNSDEINQLFSKSSETYSGSENTVFFVSRMLSILKASKHNLPLIIDGFREGEISTPTEKKMIEIFKKVNNQMIITATLKEEEYHKYDSDKLINKMDYSKVPAKHLLSQKCVDDFLQKAQEFNVQI